MKNKLEIEVDAHLLDLTRRYELLFVAGKLNSDPGVQEQRTTLAASIANTLLIKIEQKLIGAK